MSILVANKVYR